MPLSFKFLIFSVILSISQYTFASNELKLEQAYIIDGVEKLEPSGLALCNDKLLFVSDKHENTIFSLELSEQGIAKAIPYKKIASIPQAPEHSFPFFIHIERAFNELFGISTGVDWEGIACNEQGEIFLASEQHLSILKIEPNGNTEWIADKLQSTGSESGLFNRENAFIEGLAINKNGLVIAAEREPRGIIFYSWEGEIKLHIQPHKISPITRRSLDYSGLEFYQNSLFVLDRNHYQVCKIIEPNYFSGECFSLKHSELSIKWGYEVGKFGLAEGLAIDDQSVWVIFDNNGRTRLADHFDSRPVLMKFKNPFNRK